MARPRDVNVETRRAQLLKLRAAGKSYDDIVAEHPELGYSSTSHARGDLTRTLARIVDEPARDMLALELARLDALHGAIWDTGLAGDLRAIDRLIRLSERRGRITGLDAAAEAQAHQHEVQAAQEDARSLAGAIQKLAATLPDPDDDPESEPSA